MGTPNGPPYFDRAPRGAALETLQKFDVRTGTPFSSYLRALRVVVASTIEKGGPLAPSAVMAIEFVRIRTAQQYPMLMSTLFPRDLATREKPYDSLASMWTAFADLKHNTSPAIDGSAFASTPQASSVNAPPTVANSATSVAVPQRHNSRSVRPPSHAVSHVSPVHSRRDPFRVDYGLWPFDDCDYAIVCTVTKHMVNTNLFLWTLLFTEDARRQACIQYSGRCCNCGSTKHSLRWCPAPFMNAFSLLSPEFATHDAGGSIIETWKEKMCRWRRRGSNRRPQGNGRRNASGNGNPRPHNRGSTSASQGNNNGITRNKRRRSPGSTPRALERLWPSPDGCPYHAIWLLVHRYYQPERSPTRYVSGITCPYSVKARRQCHHICSTVYGTIARMPQSSHRQHTGNLYWTDIGTVPSPSHLRPCRLGWN